MVHSLKRDSILREAHAMPWNDSAPQASSPPAKCSTPVRTEPAELILQRAQQPAVQLIVLGAQHRKRLLASLRPTVTERVSHQLRCLILIVP